MMKNVLAFACYFDILGNMNSTNAIARLASLAQESRLAVFRLLVRQGPAGLAAGEIASKLKIPAATMSFHLKELSHAGLLKSRQEGRFIYYAPDIKAMNALIAYLTDHCCADSATRPEHC